MATYTGFKQAVIAFKVDVNTGAALDRNGQLISESGNRQAVLLLQGTANPNPALYDVVGYFNRGAVIDGTATIREDLEACPPDTTPVWILTTGFWDNSAQWINSETWNY